MLERSRDRRSGVSASLVALLVTVGAGCTAKVPEESPPKQSIILKDFRIPDDEGVVTSIDRRSIEIDGARRYAIDPAVESFTASGRKVTPIVHWKNRYVQVGIRAKRAIWIAGIGVVANTDPPLVFYGAEFVRLDKESRAVFDDGTVLKIRSGVEPPAERRKVSAEIDPVAKEIVRFS